MSDATTGWGAEVQLGTSSAVASLVELEEVVSFSLPEDTADKIEVTHLKSPEKRKEYIRGLIDGGDLDIEINYLPGSPTDILIRDALDVGDVRAIRFILPDQAGQPYWQITTSCICIGYRRGPVRANEKIAAVVRVSITGAQSEAAETNEATS